MEFSIRVRRGTKSWSILRLCSEDHPEKDPRNGHRSFSIVHISRASRLRSSPRPIAELNSSIVGSEDVGFKTCGESASEE